MKKKSKPVVYMLDTNILVRWASVFTSKYDETDARQLKTSLRIKAFCEENENPIVVPDIVWLEFLAVMLHKNIDVNDDYGETLRRFRDRQSLVQQIEGNIRSSENWVHEWEPDDSPFADAADLLQYPSLIDRRTFGWMRRSAENVKKKYRPDMGRLTGKILDGMDSAILICLNFLDSQDENRDRRIILYTADYPLWQIFDRVKECNTKWFECDLFEFKRTLTN